MRWVFIIGGVLAFLFVGNFLLSFINPPDMDLSNIEADRESWQAAALSCTADDIRTVQDSDPIERIFIENDELVDIPASLTASADAGDAEAIAVMVVLADILEVELPGDRSSYSLLNEAAREGSTFAQRELGRAFADGNFSLEADAVQARRYYDQAIAGGDLEAHYLMAELHAANRLPVSGRDPRSLQEIVWDRWLIAAAGCHRQSLSALAYNMAEESENPFYDPETSARLRATLDSVGN